MISTRSARNTAFYALILSFGAFASPAHAAPGDSVEEAGAAQVTMIEAITITSTADLAFGTIVAPASGTARVTINSRNGRRLTNANAVALGTEGFGPAVFALEGKSGSTVSFAIDGNAIELTGPGEPMRIDRLRLTFNGAGRRTLPTTRTMPSSGEATVRIGGRLRVPTGQTPGLYEGTFDLVVAYE